MASIDEFSHGGTKLESKAIEITNKDLGDTGGQMSENGKTGLSEVLEHLVNSLINILMFIDPFFDLVSVAADSWAVEKVLDHVGGDQENSLEAMGDVIDLVAEWHPEIRGAIDLIKCPLELVLSELGHVGALLHLVFQVNVHEAINVTEVDLDEIIKLEIVSLDAHNYEGAQDDCFHHLFLIF